MSDARLKAFCEGLEMQDIPKLMTGTVGDFRRVGEVMKEMIVEKCRRVEALEAEKDELLAQVAELQQDLQDTSDALGHALLDLEAALSRTPAQSRAEIEAGKLEREATRIRAGGEG